MHSPGRRKGNRAGKTGGPLRAGDTSAGRSGIVLLASVGLHAYKDRRGASTRRAVSDVRERDYFRVSILAGSAQSARAASKGTGS